MEIQIKTKIRLSDWTKISKGFNIVLHAQGHNITVDSQTQCYLASSLYVYTIQTQCSKSRTTTYI